MGSLASTLIIISHDTLLGPTPDMQYTHTHTHIYVYVFYVLGNTLLL